jgi:hypothetical protein
MNTTAAAAALAAVALALAAAAGGIRSAGAHHVAEGLLVAAASAVDAEVGVAGTVILR